jgi:hypothetical protein
MVLGLFMRAMYFFAARQGVRRLGAVRIILSIHPQHNFAAGFVGFHQPMRGLDVLRSGTPAPAWPGSSRRQRDRLWLGTEFPATRAATPRPFQFGANGRGPRPLVQPML